MSQQPANFGTVTCSQQSGASLFDSELPFKIELSQDEKINREVSFSYGAHQDFCGVHASFPPQKNQCESSDECQKHPKAACPSSLSPPLPSLNNQQQQDYTATSLYDVGTDPYAGSRTHNSVYRYSEPLGSHDSFSLAESSARSAVLSSQFTASPYNAQHEGFDRSSTTNNEETDIEEKNCDPPYAKLIYQALMDVPEHKMVLRDIYRWIEQNTDKARDPAFKGWQNSVRHNLSMNGAFRKVPHSPEIDRSKKGYIWILEPSAIEFGIESTTRYRHKHDGKKVGKSGALDVKRQRSGRKGGFAARKSAKWKKCPRLDEPKNASYVEREVADLALTSPGKSYTATSEAVNQSRASSVPYYSSLPPLSSQCSLPPYASYYFDGLCSVAQPSDTIFTDSFYDSSSAMMSIYSRGSKSEGQSITGGQDCLA